MQERLTWHTLRTCDAVVESAIGNWAYQETLDRLVGSYPRVIVNFCRTQIGSVEREVERRRLPRRSF